LLTAAGFVPNGRPPLLRAKYIKLKSPINKLIDKSYHANVIILPLQVALQIEGAHFSQVHWTPNKGKPQGRLLADCSDFSASNCINGPEVKALSAVCWGELVHPTLSDILSMIAREADSHGWDNLVLWKMDLRGAFSLVNIHPDSVRLLCFLLTDDLVMLAHTGNFGLTEFPYIFGVITRVCQRAISKLIRGSSCMYVDDLMGVCAKRDLQHDMSAARAFFVGLLGSNSVEDKKTESGRRIDLIGWCIDLDMRSFTIASHNFKKLIHGLFTLDVDKPMTLKTVQRLASWFQRYSEVCQPLKPFLPDLLDALRDWRNPNAPRRVHQDAKDCISLWRVYAILLRLRESTYSRSISSHLSRSISYYVEFDASLTGLGIKVTTADGGVFAVAQCSILDFDLQGDSSWQNTVEFLALTIALAIIASRGVVGCGIGLLGDNTSSLFWAQKSCFKSKRSRRTFMAFLSLTIASDLRIERSTHVKGVDNIVCDILSRHDKFQQTPLDLGLRSDQIFEIGNEPAVADLLAFCNPRLTAQGISGTEKATRELAACIDRLYKK
jgi:hypothetical protein